MTSYDLWAVLKMNAAAVGPEALSLVERVGEARFQTINWQLSEHIARGTAAARYGFSAGGGGTLYDMLEKELRRIDDEDARRHARQFDPTRLRFPSEPKD